MQSTIWLLITVALLAVEAMTVTLTSIWFAFGAFLAFVLSFFTESTVIQIIAFVIGSAAALVFTRPIVKKRLNAEKVCTNYDMLIGKIAVVTEKIVPLEGKGQIKIQGNIWSAKSADENEIEKGKKVIIKEIKGVNAIVYESEEN